MHTQVQAVDVDIASLWKLGLQQPPRRLLRLSVLSLERVLNNARAQVRHHHHAGQLESYLGEHRPYGLIFCRVLLLQS